MSFHEDTERSRAERDRFFAGHYASPLTDENQATFKGLDYFPPDEAWRLEAEFRPVAPERIDVPSSSGSSHPYARIGWATAFSPSVDSMRSGVTTSVRNRRPCRPTSKNGEMLFGPPDTNSLSGGFE